MFRLCGGDNDQDFLRPRHTPLLNYLFVYTDHIAVIRGYALEEREASFGCALRRGWLIRTSDNLAR